MVSEFNKTMNLVNFPLFKMAASWLKALWLVACASSWRSHVRSYLTKENDMLVISVRTLARFSGAYGQMLERLKRDGVSVCACCLSLFHLF